MNPILHASVFVFGSAVCGDNKERMATVISYLDSGTAKTSSVFHLELANLG